MQTYHRVWKLVFEYADESLMNDELIFSNLEAAQASFDAMCEAYSEKKKDFQRLNHYASWYESPTDEDLTVAFLSFAWVIINNDPVLNWEGHDAQARNLNNNYSIEFKY